jgi:hypothetical protein
VLSPDGIRRERQLTIKVVQVAVQSFGVVFDHRHAVATQASRRAKWEVHIENQCASFFSYLREIRLQ